MIDTPRPRVCVRLLLAAMTSRYTLPNDATQSAVKRLYVVCLSVRLSVRP